MIIFQKTKGDKNKEAMKQISRCLEGPDYHRLTVFCIINVLKLWQFKLSSYGGRTVTGIKIFVSFLAVFSLKLQTGRSKVELSFNGIFKRK